MTEFAAGGSWLQNPYEAERSISGRWGRVFLGGVWMAQATEVSYAVEVAKDEVKRSGTRWSDNKSGGFTGSGTLTYEKVNSDFERILIGYFNGLNSVTGLANMVRTLPSYELQVSLEDPGQPGATWDANGNMITGQEEITLHKVKFWNLEGGYGDSLISRSVEFTFAGVSMEQTIDDPPTV